MSHHETEDFMAWVRTICLVGITSGALMLGGIWSHALCAPFPSWCGTIYVVDPAAIILEVWPKSHWPGFLLRQADELQSYTA